MGITKHTTFQTLAGLVLFTCIAISPNQQERQYTTTIPARLVNQYMLVINGQLDQVTAKDYKELTESIQPQIYAQYRNYVREDSVFSARQKAVRDTTKTKKP